MSRRPRNCEVCSTQYVPTYSKQRTCSRTCGVTLRRTITGTMAKVKPRQKADGTWDRTCIECEKPFTATTARQTLCSPDCVRARSSRMVLAGYHDGRYRESLLKNVHLRRARLATVTTETISLQAVADRDDWTCRLCLKPVPKTWPEDDRSQMPSLDHTIPIARGGSHTWDNVQLAHYRCNLQKGSRTVTDYTV